MKQPISVTYFKTSISRQDLEKEIRMIREEK